MTKLPFISVIIPAKNEEAYILKCLHAVKALRYPADKIEIIVVDNGSSDNTRQIASNTKSVHVLDSNGTISAVRNHGGRAAKGEILAFLDGDCIPEPDWLSKAVSTLTREAEVAVVSAVLMVEDKEKSPWIERYWLDYLNSKYDTGINYVATISSFCFLIKRQSMDDVGWFNEDLATCEDSDLGYRIAGRGNKLVIDEQIRTIHLRNAKTTREFFMRQLWQGSSNLKNFFQHSFEWREVPSVFIPLVYFFMPFILTIGIFLSYKLFIYGSLALLISLPLGKALQSGAKASINSVLGYTYIWFLYLAGRGLGIAIKIRRSKK